jgi:putative transposase
MNSKTPYREFYRRKLPHYRSPGAIYHLRFSIHSPHIRLSKPCMFELVEASFLSWHKKSFILYAYVIMPDHCHLLIQPLWKSSDHDYQLLEEIARTLKSSTSLQINRILNRCGRFWKKEYFDRIVRNDKDQDTKIDYIHHNPVRWGLVRQPMDYRWSSAATIYSGRMEYAGWFD